MTFRGSVRFFFDVSPNIFPTPEPVDISAGMNSSKADKGVAFEDMYKEKIDTNIDILARFPPALMESITLPETMSPAEDATTSIKVKTAVSECLNALKTLSKVAADLDLLAVS
jgi:hypothetical protein